MGGMQGQMGGVPGQMGGMPGQPGMPGQMGGMPGQVGGMPGQPGMPGQMGGMPGQMGGMPGQMGGMPGQIGGMPGQIGGMPGQMGYNGYNNGQYNYRSPTDGKLDPLDQELADEPERPTNRNSFSAAAWHRERRRRILANHPEIRQLMGSDAWVASLGLIIYPIYGWVLVHFGQMSIPEQFFHLYLIGSLRSTWAVYCSHAISHGRWSNFVGGYGSTGYNAALALVNFGTLFGVYPNYWLFHNRHHTALGQYPLLEARERAAEGLPTDGDIGLSRVVLHSAPSRKYTLALTAGTPGVPPQYLPRQNEVLFQMQSVLLHIFAPVLFAGSAATRFFASIEPGSSSKESGGYAFFSSGPNVPGQSTGRKTINKAVAVQSISQLYGWAAVATLCASADSYMPWVFYTVSQALWLSPLNVNWLWTNPHICERGSNQPTVSFYTPQDGLGQWLDFYMGWENYHVEHHDFPDIPMYNLPKLRRIAPEEYMSLRSMPVMSPYTWQQALSGEYFYACQDLTFGPGVPAGSLPDVKVKGTLQDLGKGIGADVKAGAANAARGAYEQFERGISGLGRD